MYGKTIHLLGHTGSDLIDVIDDDVVSAEFPKYPGHEEAARRWQEQVDNGAKAKQKKPFYEREFGLPMNVDSYIKLGHHLARERRRPEALKRIVDDAICIATGQPAHNAVTVEPLDQAQDASKD
jgi:hypothetical protein